jgi:FkbM family methyltransferase
MNIFLDCGFYAGHALRKYIEAGVVDKTWTIYGFEPNPDIEVESQLAQYDVDIKLIKKAVWTKNGKITFHIAGRNDAAGIANLTGHHEPKEVEVKTFNFSKFVADLPPADKIICSMDIEGAEYVVLEKMIKDKTIDRFDILDIEFHHRFMLDYDQTHSQALIDQIEAKGIEVKLKVPLI